MFINKECELHDVLKLHTSRNGMCGCGARVFKYYETGELRSIIPDASSLAIMLFGEERLRRLGLGIATADDFDIFTRLLHLTPVLVSDEIHDALTDDSIQERVESAQAEFISVAIELYKKHEFPVGRSILRDTECNKLAEERWRKNESLRIQAKAPIELGWNFIAETEKNITDGNKARIYERDGIIAIQHRKNLTPLNKWQMRCRQLFRLMGQVCDSHKIVGQCHPRISKWVLEYVK